MLRELTAFVLKIALFFAVMFGGIWSVVTFDLLPPPKSWLDGVQKVQNVANTVNDAADKAKAISDGLGKVAQAFTEPLKLAEKLLDAAPKVPAPANGFPLPVPGGQGANANPNDVLIEVIGGPVAGAANQAVNAGGQAIKGAGQAANNAGKALGGIKRRILGR